MLRWVLVSVLPLCWAQVEISGVVVDVWGAPIADVRLDHSGTDAKSGFDGKFRVKTNAAAIVFRRNGYGSTFRRSSELRGGNVTMVRQETKEMPACKGHRLDTGVNPFLRLFAIPPTKGINAFRPVVDREVWSRTFQWSQDSSAKMVHEHNGSRASGLPFDDDVHESFSYSESLIEAGAMLMIEARGVTELGKHWRYLGRFSEFVSYRNVSFGAAAVFDRAIDGVCGVN